MKKWQVIEDIDGAYVYPLSKDQNPDDLCFGRTQPIAKLNDQAPAELVREFCWFINGKPDKRKRAYRINHAYALQREHERQSNWDAMQPK